MQGAGGDQHASKHAGWPGPAPFVSETETPGSAVRLALGQTICGSHILVVLLLAAASTAAARPTVIGEDLHESRCNLRLHGAILQLASIPAWCFV